MRQTQKEIDFYTASSNTNKVRNLDYENEKDYRRPAWAWKSLWQTLISPKKRPSLPPFVSTNPKSSWSDTASKATNKEKLKKNPKIQSNKQRKWEKNQLFPFNRESL